jgi:hypothetical protein
VFKAVSTHTHTHQQPCVVSLIKRLCTLNNNIHLPISVHSVTHSMLCFPRHAAGAVCPWHADSKKLNCCTAVLQHTAGFTPCVELHCHRAAAGPHLQHHAASLVKVPELIAFQIPATVAHHKTRKQLVLGQAYRKATHSANRLHADGHLRKPAAAVGCSNTHSMQA